MLRADPGFKSHSGFTLVELMITVAVIGILAAIAYPSYTQYVIRAKRADAQAIMMENVQFLERYFTTHGSYADADLPKPQSPASGAADYNMTTPTLSATAYVIQATPTGTFSDPVCETLTISQTGQRTPSLSDCWRN